MSSSRECVVKKKPSYPTHLQCYVITSGNAYSTRLILFLIVRHCYYLSALFHSRRHSVAARDTNVPPPNILCSSFPFLYSSRLLLRCLLVIFYDAFNISFCRCWDSVNKELRRQLEKVRVSEIDNTAGDLWNSELFIYVSSSSLSPGMNPAQFLMILKRSPSCSALGLQSRFVFLFSIFLQVTFICSMGRMPLSSITSRREKRKNRGKNQPWARRNISI